MALPTNAFQQVITYNDSGLALLLNSFAFLSKANKKFKDFDKGPKNLGDTVSFDLPPRYSTNPSLVAVFQDSEQRVQNLTVDQPYNTAYAFNAQQFIFNAREYMEKFGKSAIAELGTKVEANIAQNAITHTYRFFGDGVAAINTFGQLALAKAYFTNYGAAKGQAKGFLEDIATSAIVNSGLSQFVIDRNEELANSWELGSFKQTDWFESNLLPIHTAGTVGIAATTLVITAVVTESDGGISAITCSGAGTDADAIKENDLLQFSDGVSGQPNVRYRTFIGHEPSANPVQIRATADAVSATDSVTIPIYPYLYSVAGKNQNVTETIVASMELKALPSHRAGVLYAGDPLYVAMPQLPEEIPFPTGNNIDSESGCSIRTYYGSKFGLNERGMVHDVIWGSTLVDEYAMRLVFPL